MKTWHRYSLLLLISFFMILTLSSCATPPLRSRENICYIFKARPEWYWSAQDVQRRWGLPMPVLMSIIYQESNFIQHAKPPREHILWVIPWFRPTSAYGYSQAVRDTWLAYKRSTGNARANRNDFDDAADFIGWYTNLASQKLGIPKTDAYKIYLAYHEGTGGYARGTYRHKQWLIDVSRHVQQRAWTFESQLARCQASLPEKHWWNFL